MKKNLLFWLFFVLSIMFATYFGTRVTMGCFFGGDISSVKSLKFTGNLDPRDIPSIQASIGISSKQTNIFELNLNEVNTRISNRPEIKHSSVRRKGNGVLDITIEQYEPVATWTDGQFYYPITENGIVISTPTNEKPNNSFIFTGKTKKFIGDLITSAQPLFNKIESIELIENRRWNIHLKNDITIMLPENGFIPAIGSLIIIDNKHQILSKDIEQIDMRDASRTLVK